ncbi:MAG: glycosyltransferase family 2 protein [Planctomycetota bacterium]|jgi:glycosyltransferase involved in cell wall biosynthesis
MRETANKNQGHPVRSLSVFFPCYNEKGSIGPLTEKALSVAGQICEDHEVILIDDGSSDGTAELADRLAEQYPAVHVVHHPSNQGYGAALQSGFRAATKDYVFYTDGDGQFDIAELPKLLPLIQDYDIVSGYRIDRQDNLLRKINAFCWTKLVGFLFDLKLKDIDCAFKLYKRGMFDHIEMHSTGALIDTEILARAQRKGYTTTQIGVHHFPRTAGQQTGANVKVILRAFKELFKLRKQIRQAGKR